MLGFLAAIKGAIKTLDDRWSATRQGYLDRLNTDYTTPRAGYITTMNGRIDLAISTRLRAPVVTVYTTGTDQTYTRRNTGGASYCWVTLLGGGGGGGGANNFGTAAGGGGGGERLRFWIRLVANPTYTVGTGGGGGAAGMGGGNGTSTWFNGIVASGGDGGAGGYSGAGSGVQGIGGGAARIYDVFNDGTAYSFFAIDGSMPGGGGGGYGAGWAFGRNINFYTNSSIYKRTQANDGGHTEYGIGGVGAGTSANGSAATGYGAGGGGAYGDNYTGGAGAGGLIIIEDYGDIDSGN